MPYTNKENGLDRSNYENETTDHNIKSMPACSNNLCCSLRYVCAVSVLSIGIASVSWSTGVYINIKTKLHEREVFEILVQAYVYSYL
jgi:hypothetical protein